MSIDSHCHLADAVFAADLDAVVARARAAGVTSLLCILAADEPEELARAEVVRGSWADVRFAASIHPHHAGTFAGRIDDAVDTVKAAAERMDADAIGEIGLDYHYDFAPRDVQREVFEAQVALAVETNRPVVIHTREAFADTVAVLSAARPAVQGVMHCFSGTVDETRQALDLGFYISMSGIVTFPKAAAIRDVAAFVPEDRLLIETDAPYLAPVPNRGKRNEPAWVTATLAVVASVRGVAPADLEARLAANLDTFVSQRRRAGGMSR